MQPAALSIDVETSAWRKRSHFEVCVYFDVLEICLCVIFGSGGVGFLTYDGPATLAVGKPDRTVNHCLATGLLPGLERLPALDFIGTPMADRASYPGLQDNLPRAQDWSSE